MPIFFDTDTETFGHLPSLGGSAFGISRLRYAIAGVRLRPPSLGPHLFHRKMAAEARANADGTWVKKDGRTVSIAPRAVGEVGYRKTTNGLYSKVQTEEKRGESVLDNARRAHSRRKQIQESPLRGRSPALSSNVE